MRFPLTTKEEVLLHLNMNYLDPYKEQLHSFLENQGYMHTKEFAQNIMLGEEIKANNNVEGYLDDLNKVESIINKKKTQVNKDSKQRILNLYKGYLYILKEKEINQEHLKELYEILSQNLLDEYDKKYMGDYYRTKPVYILKKGRLDLEPYTGIDAEKIQTHMNQFFDFINTPLLEDNEINQFIKSQIMHFYFVYIHPYFDVNGRTSRTVAMWYLLKSKDYPYIIFNRAIALNQKGYDENIIKGRNKGDVTLFIKYMLTKVLCELEKQYIIHQIQEVQNTSLSKTEAQILEYLLSLNGNITIKDLTCFYNRFNEKKKPNEIYEKYLTPLLEKKILQKKRETTTYISPTTPNCFLNINPDCLKVDKNKIRHLSLEKYK